VDDHIKCFETVSPNYKSAVIPSILFPLCLLTMIAIPSILSTNYDLWLVIVTFFVSAICIVWSAVEEKKMRILQIEKNKIKYSQEILQVSDINKIVLTDGYIQIRKNHGNMYTRTISFRLIDKQLLKTIKDELDEFAKDNKIEIKSTYQ
jgi:Na+-transporting NADH:ubiquinone oxidoreductase subunit NqrC